MSESVKPFETFHFSNKNKMLGVLMVQELEDLKQEISITDEERHFKEFPGVTCSPTVISDGKSYVTITLDLCNDVTMKAISEYYGGPAMCGHYSDPGVRDRIVKMRDQRLKAYQVGWNEVLKLDGMHPFSSAAVINPHRTEPAKLFNNLNASLGPKAMLVVYAYDIKPGIPSMFYIGSKQAKKDGLLNMTQWRDTTEEEGMMVFNTFRDDLKRIGRDFMYS